MQSMTAALTDFNTQPRVVKRWLDALPIAHIGETSRQLYIAMRDVNQEENVPVKHRFNFLEGIAEPLNMILPELHKHYVGKPLPLSKKRRKIADLYTQLLRQSILGYQQVIARAIDLNRFGWKKVVTTSVHRIFHYSGLLLLNQRLLYQPYQKGLWLQLYWLYQMVESYKLLNAKVACRYLPGKKSTLSAEFNKLLLHSLLAPNLFRPQELEEVLNNMDSWIDTIITAKQRPSEHDQTYAFTLDTDIPPGLMASNLNISENPEIDVRYLNLTPLLQYLNHLLTQAKPGVDQIHLTRHQVISRRSLLLLLNNWGRPTSRDGERRLIQGQAEVAIGISAIHYIIAEGRQEPQRESEEQILVSAPDSFISMHTDPKKSDNSLSALGFTTDRDVHTDIWESAYFEPEPTPLAWTESIRMKVYSYLNAKVLNISKGGFCIALPYDGVENIQTSDLVVIRGKRGEWQLGEIRWLLCPSNAPIRAGIQKHSTEVLPALLQVQSKNNPVQPIKCLIGRNDTGNIVFLPNLPFSLADKNMLLEVNGESRRFKLDEQLYATPVGSAFYFNWHKTQENPTTKAASNAYESIWAKL
jgi:hypothetical protein